MKTAGGALALITLFTAGCVRYTVGVSPGEILDHLPELRSQGHAVVATLPDGGYDLAVAKVVQAEFPARALFGILSTTDTRAIAVRDLIVNCPASPCLLQKTTSESLIVGSRRRPDWSVLTIVGGVTGGLALFTLVVGLPLGLLLDHSHSSPMGL